MRTREEIYENYNLKSFESDVMETLLDIRDLLIKLNNEKGGLNKNG